MTSKQIALAIAPKVGGALSILGSSWILVEIVANREKRKLVYHRLIVMFSVFDIIVSSGSFASTWPMEPQGNGSPWNAIGNKVSCTMQGFALQLGSTLFTYNAFLSFFYILVVNYSISEDKLRKHEWALHIFPLLFGTITSVIPAALGWYNNANLWCWIAADPICVNGGTEPYEGFCERYDNIIIFRWVFFFGPLWLSSLVQVVCLFLVFRGVRRKEQQSLQYQQPTLRTIRARAESRGNEEELAENSAYPDQSESVRTSLRNLPRTRQVGSQAVLYILAFFGTYMFATINRIVQQVQGQSPFTILLLHSFTLPMQGFWNFLIYRRPHYLRLRRSKMTVKEAIQSSVEFSFLKQRRNGGQPVYCTGNSNDDQDDSHRPRGFLAASTRILSSLQLISKASRRSLLESSGGVDESESNNRVSTERKESEEKEEIEEEKLEDGNSSYSKKVSFTLEESLRSNRSERDSTLP